MTVTNRPAGLRQLARSVRVALAGGSGVLALVAVAVPLSVQAQDAASVNEVVVTGSRIVRDGFEAPTPLTVVGSEQIAQQASPNVIDYMTTMPAFAGNYTPQSSSQNVSAGTAGTSSVNLRNLGTNRTLVLINGQRVVPSTVTGLVDINTVPSQLIERVEVVTGGASAAYGSDAVSGVVNFILNNNFTGFEAELSGGMTEYGDDENGKLSMTAGFAFAGGRGHVIISGEHNQRDGILHGDREWNRRGWQIINNPNYLDANRNPTGEPQRLLLPRIAPSNATPGGIIIRGPLRGVAFGQNGEPYRFNFGSLVSGSAMQGGDWEESSLHHWGQSLQPKMSSDNVYARASFEITENTSVYLQSNWYASNNQSHAYPNDAYFGGMFISADNPFIPASTAQAIADLRANGQTITQLEMGHSLRQMGPVLIDTGREVVRNVLGVDGSFDAFGTNWNWDAYYQQGESRGSESARNSLNLVRHELALDAVRDPVTGAIVCSSTLTDPTNGCVPYNPFGINVNSEAALRYSAGLVSHRAQRFKQQVVATSVSGEPFSNWVGPVSVAAGVEHRRESVTGQSTEADLAGEFFAGNYRPTFGKYHVTEGFFETLMPLLADKPLVRALDFNGAVRFTDYSESGSVTTWKAGLTYSMVDDLRFRVTRSRDIRAPNLNDMFNAGLRENNQVFDHVSQTTVAVENFTRGNPALKPEEADSWGVGLVYQPSFLPSFSTSVDYWEIDLGGAISTTTAQQVVDLCFQGHAQSCAAINDGQPLTSGAGADRNRINRQPFNLAQQLVKGVDIEMSYRLPVAPLDGNVNVRAMATRFLKNYTDNTLNTPFDTAGQNYGGGPPDWRWNASVNYDHTAFRASLTARGISSGVYDNRHVVCTSNCPVSTIDNPTINYNRLAGAVYLDLSLGYKMTPGDMEVEAFLNVRNLANKDPVIAVGGPSGLPFDTVSTVPSNYDSLGRIYRLGVKVKM